MEEVILQQFSQLQFTWPFDIVRWHLSPSASRWHKSNKTSYITSRSSWSKNHDWNRHRYWRPLLPLLCFLLDAVLVRLLQMMLLSSGWYDLYKPQCFYTVFSSCWKFWCNVLSRILTYSQSQFLKKWSYATKLKVASASHWKYGFCMVLLLGVTLGTSTPSMWFMVWVDGEWLKKKRQVQQPQNLDWSTFATTDQEGCCWRFVSRTSCGALTFYIRGFWWNHVKSDIVSVIFSCVSPNLECCQSGAAHALVFWWVGNLGLKLCLENREQQGHRHSRLILTASGLVI